MDSINFLLASEDIELVEQMFRYDVSHGKTLFTITCASAELAESISAVFFSLRLLWALYFACYVGRFILQIFGHLDLTKSKFLTTIFK